MQTLYFVDTFTRTKGAKTEPLANATYGAGPQTIQSWQGHFGGGVWRWGKKPRSFREKPTQLFIQSVVKVLSWTSSYVQIPVSTQLVLIYGYKCWALRKGKKDCLFLLFSFISCICNIGSFVWSCHFSLSPNISLEINSFLWLIHKSCSKGKNCWQSGGEKTKAHRHLSLLTTCKWDVNVGFISENLARGGSCACVKLLSRNSQTIPETRIARSQWCDISPREW